MFHFISYALAFLRNLELRALDLIRTNVYDLMDQLYPAINIFAHLKKMSLTKLYCELP